MDSSQKIKSDSRPNLKCEAADEQESSINFLVNTKMRRRQHHVRSRNGCSTCKLRHVRCDERLPYCGNCLRIGRECIYTENPPGDSSDPGTDTPPVAESSMVFSLLPATRQAWLASNLPQGHAVLFLPPHYRDLYPDTSSILQQAHEILGERPMPRSCLLTIQRDHAPRYNQLAGRHKCVKDAHISLAAYTHYQERRSSVSRDLCIQYKCDALGELQKEIDNFSDRNLDAAVISSIALAGTADDWEQWLVFIDGYTKALSYIRDRNVRTSCPELLGKDFQLRKFFSQAIIPTQPPPINRPAIHQRIHVLVSSVTALGNIIGQPSWRSTGFSDLVKLAWSVDSALSLESESDAFHRLAGLRFWMFWIELGRQNEGDEPQALTCYFYALVLSVVPLLPWGYFESLTDVCVKRMEAILQDMSFEVASTYGLLELMSSVQGMLLESQLMGEG